MLFNKSIPWASVMVSGLSVFSYAGNDNETKQELNIDRQGLSASAPSLCR